MRQRKAETQMFTMTTSPFELLLRVAVVYAFLFTLIRLIGRRGDGALRSRGAVGR